MTLFIIQWLNASHKTGQSNRTVGIVHTGDQLAECLGGIVHHAAKHARMQVVFRPVDAQLEVCQAAQSVDDSRQSAPIMPVSGLSTISAASSSLFR